MRTADFTDAEVGEFAAAVIVVLDMQQSYFKSKTPSIIECRQAEAELRRMARGFLALLDLTPATSPTARPSTLFDNSPVGLPD